MKRLLFCLIIFAVITACCTNDLKEPSWKTSGELKIGTDATYPPFEMVNTESGRPEGFDIDIMRKICQINGWEPEFIVTPFDGIIPGLRGKKYDCIISAMSITPQRQAVVDFSEPYYQAGQIIAVPLQDTVVKSVENLRGLKVGVQLGTTGERFAKSLQGVTVFSFDNIGAAFIDMENGQIDAVLNDLPTTQEYIKLKGNAKTVGELLSEESYGIAVRKGDTQLLDKVNSALKQISESGEYDRIRSRWF